MAIKILDNETTEKRDTKISAKESTEEYIDKSDWRIAANSNTGYSHAALVNTLAGKVVANYWLDQVYSKKEGDAHRNGDYHIHDLDNLAAYCFTKDTKVKTVEYGDISIEELLAKNVESFTVKSTDLEAVGKYELKVEEDITEEDKVFFYKHFMNKTARNLRKTRENAELVAVEFEDGLVVKCTPDHKFLTATTLVAEEYTPYMVFAWDVAEMLKKGDKIVSVNGCTKVIKEVTKLPNREDVYCMEVEDTHCFALENGAVVHNCCGHDLQKLLNEGFNGVAGRVGSKAPKHIREALYQMANFIGILQAEWAGAQAFSSFDTYLAPLVFFDMNYGTLNFDELKKAVRNFVFNLNVPSRWGQSPFSNITIDLKCPNDLKDRNPMREHKPFFVSIYEEYKETLDKVRGAIKEQGIGVMPEGIAEKEMEVFMSWEILMQSAEDRLKEFNEYTEDMDDETVCYSLCYKHFDKEMKLITKAYYEVMNEGDAFGLPFTFPIPTINIGEDFDWDNPEYDVIWDNTAKYGSSYFQNFIGSQYLRDENGELTIRDENAYSPNDVRSMCCRLQLDKRALRKRGGGLFGSDSQTGSIGVVTINLARIGYNFKGDKKAYLKQLYKLMDMAKSTLEKKRAFVTEMVKRGLYPYTRRYVNSALNGFTTYFSTIGVNGMNESIRNFTNDEHDITDEWGQEFAKDVMTKIRERLLQYQEETGNLYNAEASPGEGCLHQNTLILNDLGKWNNISDLAKEGTANLLSFNRKTGKTEVKPAKVFLDSVSSKHYVIGFKNGLVIECTTEHPFAVVKDDDFYWSPASGLVAGDVIKGLTQDMEVVSIGIVEEEMPVYNATVEDNENFYMGDEEHGFILTHNTTYRFAKEDAKRFGDKEVHYIICEKHGRVEVETTEGEIECPLCVAEKNND